MSSFKRSKLFDESHLSTYSSKIDNERNLKDLGHPLRLTTNHFKLGVSNCKVYHYLVKIHNSDTKSKDGKRYDRKLAKEWHETYFDILNKLVDSNCQSGGQFYDSSSGSKILHAFDGKENLYTYRRLGLENFKTKFNYKFQSKDLVLDVQIKFSIELNLEQLQEHFQGSNQNQNLSELIRALETILKDGPLSTSVPVERAIYQKFDEEEAIEENNIRKINLEGTIGKKALFGHVQTIKIVNRQLNFVVDRAAHAFYIAEALTKVMNDVTNKSIKQKNIGSALLQFADPSQKAIKCIRQLNNELKDVKIETNHLSYKRKYKIFEITEQPIGSLRFQDRSTKREISVCNYYREKYQLQIDGRLPSVNVGNNKNPIYLPFEVCRIAINQKVNKLEPEETHNLIKCSTHQKIEDRFELIANKANQINEQLRNKFSNLIYLDSKPIEVDGVQLYNPKLNYQNVQNFQPVNGDWRMNDKKVCSASTLRSNELCLVNLTEKLSKDNIDNFISLFRNKANELGVSIEEPFNLNKELNNSSSFYCETSEELQVKVLDKIADFYVRKFNQSPKLIIFFIGKHKGDTIYKNIKKLSELTYGYCTQCLTEQKVLTILDYYEHQEEQRFRLSEQELREENKKISLNQNGNYILSSILLKTNSRLGGINCKIDSNDNDISKLKENLMVIGADVTHPSKSDNFNYSICSVVASLDSNYYKYTSAVRVQEKSNDEIISQMRSMIIELIDLFIRYKLKEKNLPESNQTPETINNLLPKHILYYRDGISEGQYDEFKNTEIKEILEGFKDYSRMKGIEMNHEPKVNAIIVLKRHATRFKKKDDEIVDLNAYEKNKKPFAFSSLNEEHQKQLHIEDKDEEKTFNIPAGTLVDNESVVKSAKEFYLCSHKVDKGTVRSTHYDFIINESNFKRTEIQKFTYNLCYLYAKSTKAVSIPIPVKYSHLACYRARNHLSLMKKNEVKNITHSRQVSQFDASSSSYQQRQFSSDFQLPGPSGLNLNQYSPVPMPSSPFQYQTPPNPFYASNQPPQVYQPFMFPPPIINPQQPFFAYSSSPQPPISPYLMPQPWSTQPNKPPFKQSKQGFHKSKKPFQKRNEGQKLEISEELQSMIKVKDNLRFSFYFL